MTPAGALNGAKDYIVKFAFMLKYHFPNERHMVVYYEVSLVLTIEWVSQLRHILVDTTGQQTLQACNKRAFSYFYCRHMAHWTITHIALDRIALDNFLSSAALARDP